METLVIRESKTSLILYLRDVIRFREWNNKCYCSWCYFTNVIRIWQLPGSSYVCWRKRKRHTSKVNKTGQFYNNIYNNYTLTGLESPMIIRPSMLWVRVSLRPACFLSPRKIRISICFVDESASEICWLWGIILSKCWKANCKPP